MVMMKEMVMNIYILEGCIPFKPGVILGVYATRQEAIDAAMVHREADKAEKYPIGFDYYIHCKELDAPDLMDGELIDMGE